MFKSLLLSSLIKASSLFLPSNNSYFLTLQIMLSEPPRLHQVFFLFLVFRILDYTFKIVIGHNEFSSDNYFDFIIILLKSIF